MNCREVNKTFSSQCFGPKDFLEYDAHKFRYCGLKVSDRPLHGLSMKPMNICAFHYECKNATPRYLPLPKFFLEVRKHSDKAVLNEDCKHCKIVNKQSHQRADNWCYFEIVVLVPVTHRATNKTKSQEA